LNTRLGPFLILLLVAVVLGWSGPAEGRAPDLARARSKLARARAQLRHLRAHVSAQQLAHSEAAVETARHDLLAAQRLVRGAQASLTRVRAVHKHTVLATRRAR